jgi:hypothetical protein
MRTFVPILLTGLCLPAALAAYEPPTVEPGFISLFDGKHIEKHFSIKGRKESWQAVDGAIRATPGGDRIISREEYGDFVLRLEWKVTKDGNSGVFIRVPSPDDGAPWVSGFEVQISNAPRDEAHCTGSLYGVAAVKLRPDETADVWHEFEITCLGGRITVRADGVLSVDAREEDLPEMRKRPRKGHIGLQDYHASAGTVEYRHIRIQPLAPDGTAAGFRHLTAEAGGWRKIRTGHGSGGQWDFVAGAWEGEQDPPGSGNGGVLASEAVFGDFELIVEAKPDWGVDSGVFLRSTERGACYQVLVDYYRGGNVGGIYGEGTGGFNFRNYSFKEDRGIAAVTSVTGALPLPFAPGDWPKRWRDGEYNELRCRITGNPPLIEVWLNGAYLTRFQDDTRRLDDKGHIGLQVHGGKGWPEGAKTRYRKVQVRELK